MQSQPLLQRQLNCCPHPRNCDTPARCPAAFRATPSSAQCRPRLANITRCDAAADRPQPSDAGPAGNEMAATFAADQRAEYEQLKEDMKRSTLKFSGFLAGYLLLTTNSDVALCALLGSAASFAYLQLLMRDVDAFRQDDPVASAFLMQAGDDRHDLGVLRSVGKLFAAYRAALKPRLLVFVALAGVAAAYNATAAEPLGTSESAALFIGSLSYKAGLVGQLWQSLRPKFDPEALTIPPRPVLSSFEEEIPEMTEEEEAEYWRNRLSGKRIPGE